MTDYKNLIAEARAKAEQERRLSGSSGTVNGKYVHGDHADLYGALVDALESLTPASTEDEREALADVMINSDALDEETRLRALNRNDVQREPFRMFADAILDAGYHRLTPTTVTTVEELDALPEGSVVLMQHTKGPFLRTAKQWESTRFPGKPVWDYASDPLRLPATVLFRPTPTSEEK